MLAKQLSLLREFWTLEFSHFFPEKLMELQSRDHINFMFSSTLVNDRTEKKLWNGNCSTKDAP